MYPIHMCTYAKIIALIKARDFYDTLAACNSPRLAAVPRSRACLHAPKLFQRSPTRDIRAESHAAHVGTLKQFSILDNRQITPLTSGGLREVTRNHPIQQVQEVGANAISRCRIVIVGRMWGLWNSLECSIPEITATWLLWLPEVESSNSPSTSPQRKCNQYMRKICNLMKVLIS